jgi:hypothetical protein
VRNSLSEGQQATGRTAALARGASTLSLAKFVLSIIIIVVILSHMPKEHDTLKLWSARKEKRVSEKQFFRRATGNRKKCSWGTGGVTSSDVVVALEESLVQLF